MCKLIVGLLVPCNDLISTPCNVLIYTRGFCLLIQCKVNFFLYPQISSVPFRYVRSCSYGYCLTACALVFILIPQDLEGWPLIRRLKICHGMLLEFSVSQKIKKVQKHLILKRLGIFQLYICTIINISSCTIKVSKSLLHYLGKKKI